METRRVTPIWAGPERDILTILVDPWPESYGADPSDLDTRVVLYRLLDDREEATGDIIGIEIDDFLRFDHWEALPTLPERWQRGDWEPLPIVELLKRLQQALRAQTPALVGAAALHP